jgi:hypothetical protein
VYALYTLEFNVYTRVLKVYIAQPVAIFPQPIASLLEYLPVRHPEDTRLFGARLHSVLKWWHSLSLLAVQGSARLYTLVVNSLADYERIRAFACL